MKTTVDELENKLSDYEKNRLLALQSYHIADTLNEKEYDDIAKLAAAICGTPVSLVTFVDENWQWFKAKVGTDFKGTPREIAFCEHTIRIPDEVMVVEDAAIDPRFAANPLVTENPNIRFYAGAPFTTAEGYTLGTVCVLDVVPRKLSDQQTDALRILSGQVSELLKTRRMYTELGLANKLLRGKNKLIKDDRVRLQGELQVQAMERIREISAKNAELEQINKELESFAYITSHDLQEPLRKIQTFVSILQEREMAKLSVKGAEHLQKIRTSAERMQRLIQDLLQYSRTAVPSCAFEETTLSLVFNPAIEDLRDEIEARGARIEVRNDGRLFVIGFQFHQLFYNLLSNALKFSRKNVTPHIIISLEYVEAEQGSPYFRIEFSDNGIGFDNAYSDRIFTLFQRLSSEDMVAGTGIGLTIVRKIVTNHHGTVKAFGDLNVGARFEICIPDRAQAVKASQQA
ncbi:hypothetical protein HYN48_11180 [Flavobacterium magnum]|uniref:histidine kinase n=1 Tax=Flavobacterium magnum TaxID=2162713 RepID=A0A2S0RG20_9FLAO|nr:ATP-binding protein [Flavobacterium magnum]AWA30606.1 hypothetical protein HYN48_11180 [Flavobacterium magnum]